MPGGRGDAAKAAEALKVRAVLYSGHTNLFYCLMFFFFIKGKQSVHVCIDSKDGAYENGFQ